MIFLFCMGFIYFSAIHSMQEPLERDLTTYAYIAHSMLEGQQLYSDLWDHKPPGIYLAFAAAEWIWGYGQHSLAYLWIVMVILSTFLVFRIAEQVADLRTALASVVIWTLTSNSMYLQANHPNTELFLNVFTLLAILALVYSGQRLALKLQLAGWAMALATVFKPIAVFVLAAMLLYQWTRSPLGDWQRKLREALLMFYPVFAVWMIIVTYYLISGIYNDFIDNVFAYNRLYAGNSLVNFWKFINNPKYLFHKSLLGIWVPLLLSYTWLLLGSRGPATSMPHRFFVIITLGILFEVGSIGRSHSHYYQTLIPIVALNASLFFRWLWLQENLKRGWRWVLTSGLALVCLLTLGFQEFIFFRTDAVEISKNKYGDEFVSVRDLGLAVAEITGPDDQIYYWGSESGVYYYSQRQAASGIFNNLSLVNESYPAVHDLRLRLVEDLEANPPRVLIWNTLEGNPKRHHLSAFIEQQYRQIAQQDQYAIYQRLSDPDGTHE